MTKAEVGEVIERCKYLIITANKDYAIIKAVAKEVGVQPRQIRQYVARAHEELRTQMLPNIEEERTKAISRYELIISRCIDKGQYKTAAMTQEKLDRLLGTQEATKVAITLEGKKGGEPIRVSGFMATIVDAKARAEKMREELERQRLAKNGS